MLRLLVLSLGCAAALKVDQAPAVKPALRLRGGVDTSTLVKVGAGLFVRVPRPGSLPKPAWMATV